MKWLHTFGLRRGDWRESYNASIWKNWVSQLHLPDYTAARIPFNKRLPLVLNPHQIFCQWQVDSLHDGIGLPGSKAANGQRKRLTLAARKCGSFWVGCTQFHGVYTIASLHLRYIWSKDTMTYCPAAKVLYRLPGSAAGLQLATQCYRVANTNCLIITNQRRIYEGTKNVQFIFESFLNFVFYEVHFQTFKVETLGEYKNQGHYYNNQFTPRYTALSQDCFPVDFSVA